MTNIDSLRPGDGVWFVKPDSEDMPVLYGEVEAVHDGFVDADNEYLGSVCVEADMVFRSRSEADACAESLGLDARKEY